MPSSTSSSSAQVKVALVAIAALLLSVELSTRFGFRLVSRIEGRIATQHAGALALRPASTQIPGQHQRPSVLLVGNSLLLEAVDDSLEGRMADQADIHRFVIEQTYFNDWYYGIRRLLAEGSKPDYLVLCLGPGHWVSDNIRGDYSSYYLFQTSDIHSVARDAGYSLTRESNLFFARYSMFYAGRAGLRNFVLHSSSPGYAEILRELTNGHVVNPPPSDAAPKIAARMQSLSRLGGPLPRLAVVMAPTFLDYEKELALGAAQAGLPLLIPVHAGEWPQDMFSDGFHLSSAGAKRFTPILARQLQELLARDH